MIFICVPKAHVEQYQHVGWSALLDAARSGTDGLEAIEPPPRIDSKGRPEEITHYSRGGASVFREGKEFSRPDVAALHTQGW